MFGKNRERREIHIQELEKQLEEKDLEIKQGSEDCHKFERLYHSFTHRIEAMDGAAEEGRATLEDVQRLREDLKGDLARLGLG